jgi:hypothetical protein
MDSWLSDHACHFLRGRSQQFLRLLRLLVPFLHQRFFGIIPIIHTFSVVDRLRLSNSPRVRSWHSTFDDPSMTDGAATQPTSIRIGISTRVIFTFLFFFVFVFCFLLSSLSSDFGSFLICLFLCSWVILGLPFSFRFIFSYSLSS